MKLEKYQRHALEFIRKCNGWHSYSKDRDTVRVIRSLEVKGLVKTNQCHQFRAV